MKKKGIIVDLLPCCSATLIQVAAFKADPVQLSVSSERQYENTARIATTNNNEARSPTHTKGPRGRKNPQGFTSGFPRLTIMRVYIISAGNVKSTTLALAAVTSNNPRARSTSCKRSS